MGFRPKNYVLTFEGDPELDGLVVEMGRLSIAQFIELIRIGEPMSEATAEQAQERMHARADLIAGALKGWNYEADEDLAERLDLQVGEVLPATARSVRALDSTFLRAVLSAWQFAAAGVSAPLVGRSSDGGQALALDIPMEPLPTSPPSSGTPAGS
jgi:hypothetical protein